MRLQGGGKSGQGWDGGETASWRWGKEEWNEGLWEGRPGGGLDCKNINVVIKKIKKKEKKKEKGKKKSEKLSPGRVYLAM